MKNPFSALLLAGGLSSRMGSDKAFLSYQGNPLWLHQLEKFKVIGAEKIFISRGSGQSDWECDETFVWDRFEQAGPMGGILAGMEVAQNKWMMVLAVDLPMISVSVLQNLVAAASEDGGAVYWNKSYFEPLVALYPTILKKEIQDSLEKGDRSIQRLLRKWVEEKKMISIEIPSECIVQYTNVNSVQEFTEITKTTQS